MEHMRRFFIFISFYQVIWLFSTVTCNEVENMQQSENPIICFSLRLDIDLALGTGALINNPLY